MKKLGIIGAMSVEVETLKAEMKNLNVVQKAGMEFYDGVVEPDEELPVTAASFSAPVNPRRMKQERLQALLASLLPLWVALALALLALLAWLGIALMPE